MTQRETFSYEGALWLKRHIESYWAERGQVVNCRLEPLTCQYRNEISDRLGTIKGYVVRSDMVNGYPTVALPLPVAA